MTLDKLKVGQSAIIIKVGGEAALRQHFLDMGLIPDRQISLTQFAPLGDPMELRVGGYQLSLRKAEAAHISIKLCEHIIQNSASTQSACASFSKSNPSCSGCSMARLYADTTKTQENKKADNDFIIPEHPGLGEGGNYHSKDHASPLPKGTALTFALVGNQHSGKTTLLNQLTGSTQRSDGFPDFSLEKKYGNLRKHNGSTITELPDIYSLGDNSDEELAARQFLLNQSPTAIINIVDASNLERSLYLTMQLMELDIPIVLALNMMDELRTNHSSIRVNRMEQALGIPIVPIVASKGEGIEELIEHAIHIAKYQEKPRRQDFCDKEEYGGAIHRCLHSIMHLIEDHATATDIPLRFAAIKLVEGDERIAQILKLDKSEQSAIESIVSQMERERRLDRNAAIAQMRFSFVDKLCDQTLVRSTESRESRFSRKVDELLLGKWTAIPIFLAVMVGVIWLSIDGLGTPLQQWLERLIGELAQKSDTALAGINAAPALRSLVLNGIFGGVGMVISFLPIILLLFFFLSLLEDSGYMARVAFLSDKLLRKIGLSGRSIVPLLIGFGCSVPAVMAARSLPSSRDRKLTILLTPYMSCSAKIPIYAFMAAAFFPGRGGLVMATMYIGAILVGILIAAVLRLLRKEEASPFVMEMPPYRMPALINVARRLWNKAKDFLKNAFTVIFGASIVIWLLQSFDFSLRLVSSEESMLASIAGLVAPVFEPLGLGDWRIVTSLLTGFIAKESVVASLQLLNVLPSLNVVAAVGMLVFCLLYTPCVATIAAVKRELGSLWAIGMVIFQCVLAWVVSLAAVSLTGLLFI